MIQVLQKQRTFSEQKCLSINIFQVETITTVI